MQAKSAGYYDSFNTMLFEALPLDASGVLEIGCGSGSLGAAFKARRPQCRYMGVELDPAAAAIAATRLDRVWCAPVESLSFDELAGRIDCLVYGDVLEHLVDPWGVLRSHRGLLAAGGQVIASIPNVQHWALLQNLLHGRWRYIDHGILDDTHLRFFTLHSIMELFEGASLRLDSVIGVTPNPDRADEFFQQIAPALGPLGVDAERFRQQIGPLQFVVRGIAV